MSRLFERFLLLLCDYGEGDEIDHYKQVSATIPLGKNYLITFSQSYISSSII